jgi:hypothetical protein
MPGLNRRVFLHQTLGTAAAIVAEPNVLHSAATPSDTAIPQPCAPTAWHKHGTVIEPTESWEGTAIQNFTSPPEPLGPESFRGWRIWYSPSGRKHSIAYAEGTPGNPMHKVPARCTPGEPGDGPFEVGHLPDGWNPVQVVHIHLRSGRHRIYFWAHGPGIARYLAADSDDGQRYTVVNPLRPVLYHPHDRAAHGVASPDGVMMNAKPNPDRPATEPPAIPRLISNDATNIYQLADGSFEMYSTALVSVPKSDPAYCAHDNAPGLLRVIDRYTSEDGLHFETRERVIQRDARDPVDQQFYHLAVTFTPKGRVGMLGHYRCEAQTMDLEWCFSIDGSQWQRPHRRAWLPRGDEKQPDSYGIYPPSGLVHHDRQWHLFYTGVNSAHNGEHSFGPPRSVIMYATTKSIWA